MKKRIYINLMTIVILLLTISVTRSQSESNGIKPVEINESDYPVFGIIAKKTGFDLITNFESPADNSLKYKKFVLTNGNIGLKNVRKNEMPKASKLTPNLIVVQSENKSAAYFNYLNDYLGSAGKNDLQDQSSTVAEANTGNWICFHLTVISTDEKPYDIYLWYDKNSDFEKKIPESLKGSITPENNPGTMNPAVFTEIRFFPNPVRNGNAEISFTLSDSRTADIVVYDISGNLKLQIAKEINFISGVHLFQMNLSEFPSGMYVLAITTDKQEKSIIKIIVLNN